MIFILVPAIARLLQLTMLCLLNVTQTNVSKGILKAMHGIVKQSAKKPWMLLRQKHLFGKNSVENIHHLENCTNLIACLLLEAISSFNAFQYPLTKKLGNSFQILSLICIEILLIFISIYLMVILLVEFSREGYKSREAFG